MENRSSFFPKAQPEFVSVGVVKTETETETAEGQLFHDDSNKHIDGYYIKEEPCDDNQEQLFSIDLETSGFKIKEEPDIFNIHGDIELTIEDAKPDFGEWDEEIVVSSGQSPFSSSMVEEDSSNVDSSQLRVKSFATFELQQITQHNANEYSKQNDLCDSPTRDSFIKGNLHKSYSSRSKKGDTKTTTALPMKYNSVGDYYIEKMDDEREADRIRSLIADLENESGTEDDLTLDEGNTSEYSDVEEAQIPVEQNSDTEESEEEGLGNALPQNTENRVPFYLGRNGTTPWSYTPVKAQTQTRSHNILTKLPGPIRDAKGAKSAFECFSLFFPKDFIDSVVQYTNIKIRSSQQNYNRERDANETDHAEICAYIGVLYMLGVSKSNNNRLHDVWRNDGLGIEIFRLVMGVNRFKFLQQMLRFDDISDPNRANRKSIDHMYCIREIFEKFVNACKANYSHSDFVTVDEMLPYFRGRCSFRVFMPQKPSKYGIKVWACSDAKTFYTSNMEVFLGQQNPGPFQLNNKITATVYRMVSHIENTGRNVTCDNLFTSVPLAESLLQKKLTLVGTIRKNKAEIPLSFVAHDKNRPVPSSVFGFSSNATLVSYKPKPSKIVLLLSTFHDNDAIDEDSGDAAKPEIITFYNKTKIGVDTADVLQKKYSVSRVATRWPLAMFYFMLNVGGVNSYVIFRHNSQENIIRRQFLNMLGKSLVADHCKRRLYETNISNTMKLRMCEIFSLPRKREAERPHEEANAVEARCSYCSSKKNRKTKTKCKTCSKHICREHTTTICTTCDGNVTIEEDE